MASEKQRTIPLYEMEEKWRKEEGKPSIFAKSKKSSRKKEWEKYLTKFWKSGNIIQHIDHMINAGFTQIDIDFTFPDGLLVNGEPSRIRDQSMSPYHSIGEKRVMYEFLIKKKYVPQLDFGDYERMMIEKDEISMKKWYKETPLENNPYKTWKDYWKNRIKENPNLGIKVNK